MTDNNKHPTEIVRQDLFWYWDDIKHSPQNNIANRDATLKARVGIIDTGCDTQHPCLRQCKSEEIDFTAFEQGGSYGKTADVTHCADIHNLRHGLSKLGITIKADTNGYFGLINQLIDDFNNKDPKLSHHNIENPAHRYGSHGIACAGLIAAHEPTPDLNPENAEQNILDIGFLGLFPGCELLSIATPFSQDVKPIIRAVLYCLARDVDVILIPRSIYNHPIATVSTGNDSDSRRDDAVTHTSENNDDKDKATENQALNWLLDTISQKIPVVFASGNNGLDKPEYPAVPVWRDSIIVGAHNSNGQMSAYTSGNMRTLTVTAPSDDEETLHLNSIQQFDKNTVDSLNKSSIVNETATQATIKSIATLDSVYRYMPRLSDDPIYGDPTSLDPQLLEEIAADPNKGYQLFGGTSASSAIVAGAIAYFQALKKSSSTSNERLTVRQIHSLLSVHMNEQTGIHRLDMEMAIKELNKEFLGLSGGKGKQSGPK